MRRRKKKQTSSSKGIVIMAIALAALVCDGVWMNWTSPMTLNQASGSNMYILAHGDSPEADAEISHLRQSTFTK